MNATRTFSSLLLANDFRATISTRLVSEKSRLEVFEFAIEDL